MTTVDLSAELDLLRLLYDEARIMGAPHGKRVLDRLQLREDDFTHHTHRGLFGAMATLIAAETAPDEVQLRRAAPQLNGELERFCRRDGKVLSWEQCEGLADHLRDLSRRRALIGAAERAREAVEGGGAVADVLARLDGELKSLPHSGPTWLEPGESMDALDKHLARIQEGATVAFLPTGIEALDRALGGFWADLNVINARGGVGKSAVIATALRNLSLSGHHSLAFLPEDGSRGVRIRHLAREAGVSMRTLFSPHWGSHLREAVKSAKARIKAWPGKFLIDERRALSPTEVLQSSRVAILTRGVRLVVVDNMTAMAWPRSERGDLDRQDFCRQASDLAQEFGIPFVVLCHVKASVPEDRVPTLEDCPESAGMSKVARVGIGLCRSKGGESLTVGISKGNFAGPSGATFELAFDGPSGLVRNEDETEDEVPRPTQESLV